MPRTDPPRFQVPHQFQSREGSVRTHRDREAEPARIAVGGRLGQDQHLLQIGTQRNILLALVQQHFDPAGHYRQRVVELVHEAGRELTQNRELMR